LNAEDKSFKLERNCSSRVSLVLQSGDFQPLFVTVTLHDNSNEVCLDADITGPSFGQERHDVVVVHGEEQKSKSQSFLTENLFNTSQAHLPQ
jgi:hypothetical protein